MEPIEWGILGALLLIGGGVGVGAYNGLSSAGQSIGQGVNQAEQQVATGVNVALILGGAALCLYALNKSKA